MLRKRLFLSLVAGLTVLLVILVLSDVWPGLRGPAPGTTEWHWPYRLRPFSRWWVPGLVAFINLGIATWWLSQAESQRRRLAAGLIALVLGNLLLQLSLVYADRPSVMAELVDRTLSNESSGYFEPAAEIRDINLLLRDYATAMPFFVAEHARTRPPALVTANWLTIQAFALAPALSASIARHILPLRCADLWLLDQPAAVAAALAVWAILPSLLGAFTVLPAYALARRLLSHQAAQLAAVLVATIPALLLFVPGSVQLDALLITAALFTLHLGLVRRSRPWFFTSGLLLSLATFFSLGNAAALLLFASYAGLYIFMVARPDREQASLASMPSTQLPYHWSHLTTYALAFGLGLAGVWLVYWLGYGVPPWTIAQTGLQQHYELVTWHRRYTWWVVYNLVDLGLYSGLPLMAGFAAMTILSIRNLVNKRLRAIGALSLALALLIGVLDISGSARGEVGRLWLFFMPLMALPAASFLSRVVPGRRAAVLIIGLQLAIIVSIGLAWQPVRAVIVVAERPPMSPAAPATHLDAVFGESISLRGYSLDASEARPGGWLDLTLHWEATGPALRPYTVFNHVVSEGGELVAQKDNWPVDGRWPPTCWRAGEEVTDPYRIDLPPNLPAGPYTLLTGLYDAASGQRLPLIDGRDVVRLSSVSIVPE